VPVGQVVSVARVEELPPGSAELVQVDDTEIAVFHCDDGFYATQAHCLHLGGPLAKGHLHGCVLSCPWHGWQYDVRTGENEFDRALKLETYEVLVEDGEVKVVL
jgi:nitrite reductase/ring-hydroxylating ferredoxin subunit